MNNSIKQTWTLTKPYLPLPEIGLSCNYINTVDYHLMSAFKAGNVSAFKLDTNIDLNF